MSIFSNVCLQDPIRCVPRRPPCVLTLNHWTILNSDPTCHACSLWWTLRRIPRWIRQSLGFACSGPRLNSASHLPNCFKPHAHLISLFHFISIVLFFKFIFILIIKSTKLQKKTDLGFFIINVNFCKLI